MRFREQPSALAFSLVALVLAVLTGLLIPLAGGSGGSASNQNWTPPPTASPTLHATPESTQPTSAATAGVIAMATTTAKAMATDPPTPAPPSTSSPSPTASPVLPTQTASPVPTLAPTAATMARIPEGPVNLRAGPGPAYKVLGIGEPGDEFGIVGRSEDSQWVKLCCVAQDSFWASVAFITFPADINTLPVVR